MINNRQRRAGTLSSAKDLVVVGENGNGDPAAIVVLDPDLPSARGRDPTV